VKRSFRRKWAIALFIGLLVGTTALAAGSAAGSRPQARPNVAETIKAAKQLLAQGHRRQALELLDKLRGSTKNKTTLKEIDEKRHVFAEQFMTSESFQNYQEAKGLADLNRWEDCVRGLDGLDPGDQDNVQILRLKATCQSELKKYDLASGSYRLILALVPSDSWATLGLAEAAFFEKRTADGLTALEKMEARSSADIERYTILKAKLLEQGGRLEEAADLLNKDQQDHLDHVRVLYELGMLYSRMAGHDWPARKSLSLFVTRCKRMTESELKTRHLNLILPQAQSALTTLDKKLGV
jgi:tetratricopeptide (TPR) repeat protein